MSGARRRFRFIKEIAEGGFGKVYLAEQISSDGFSRIVAIKLLHAKWSTHDEVVMRTRDEARLLGLIRHQHIVKVEDLTSIDGKCALVMEYLEGVDLKFMMQHLQDRGMDFPRAALFEIILASASALDAAYNGEPLQGGEPLKVIHRDIKPSNIFVTVSGGVKVLDFGTARANFAEREAKTQALAFGSQGYMAPERMLGEEDTPAADVFSLGVTLYELLALEPFGRIPPRPNKFLAKLEEKISKIRLEGDPEWADQVRETLRLMLSYEPSERPTAAQLVDIFELLAQNAKDMGLRRFCRSLVAESKAAEPELDTGDPLTGSTVQEDMSGPVGAGGEPLSLDGAPEADATVSGAFGQPPPPPKAAGLGLPPPSVDDDATDGPPARPPKPARTGNTGAIPKPTAKSLPPEDEAPKKGGIMGLVVAGGAGVVVLAGGALLVVVLAIGGWWYVSNQPSTPTPIADKPATPDKPPEPAKAAGPKNQGGKVVSEDARKDVKRSATTLKLDGAEWADVTVTGGVGFKGEWDGKGEFAAGNLAEGSYKATLSLPDGKKIRNKTFDVVGGKKCAFTFQVKGEKWEGSCS